MPEGKAPPFAPDTCVALLSLPNLFNTTAQTVPAEIPYITADPELIEEWSQKLSLDNNIRVGLCWHGSTHNAFPNKNIPLTLLEPLQFVSGITLYSLQKIDGLEEFNT